MRALALLLIVLAVAVALGFQGEPGKLEKIPIPDGAGTEPPTTRAEAHQVLLELEDSLRKITGATGTAISKQLPADPDKAVTRSEVLDSFEKLYKLFEPKFKITPRPIAFDATAFTVPEDRRALLANLVRKGFVAKVGPLAAGASESLTLTEFGDAVAMFMARMADVTHMPDPVYSPYIGGGTG